MKKRLTSLATLSLALLMGCPPSSDGHEGHQHDSHGHEAGEHSDGDHVDEPENGHEGHDHKEHSEGGSR